MLLTFLVKNPKKKLKEKEEEIILGAFIWNHPPVLKHQKRNQSSLKSLLATIKHDSDNIQ